MGHFHVKKQITSGYLHPEFILVEPYGSGILLSAMISFSTSVVASTQDLTLQQAIEQVNQYQASQNFWETQNSINATNLQQSKLFKNPELSVEQTGFGSE